MTQSCTDKKSPCLGLRGFALRALSSLLIVGLGLGCGANDTAAPSEGEKAVEGGSQTKEWVDVRTPAELEKPTPYFRVRVDKDGNGSLVVVSVSSFVTSLRPMPNLSGNFAAATFGEQGAIDAVPFGFQTTLRMLESDANGNIVHEDSTQSLATADFFLPALPEVQSIELYDSSGKRVLLIGSAELPKLPLKRPEVTGRYATSEERLTRSTLEGKYPHINFEAVRVADDLVQRVGEPVEISEARADKLDRALSKLPPLQLSCIQSLNITQIKECESDQVLRDGGPMFCLPKDPSVRYAKGMAPGTTVLLNGYYVDSAPVEPTLALVLLHEATHCIQNLTDPYVVEWPESIRGALTKLVDEYRLVAGFREVFQQINDTAVSSGFAQRYIGDQWLDLPYAPVPVGYASVYALNNASDDMCELAATAQLPDEVSEQKPGVCHSFHALASSQLPRQLAIAYAKLALLRGTGALSGDRFRACTQPVSFDALSEGIVLPGAIEYDQNVRLEEQSTASGGLLTVLADGPNAYRVRLDVAYSRGNAVGLYAINDNPPFFLPLGQTAFYTGPDDVFKARLGAFGLVLVTEHSASALRGVIFSLNLANGGGDVTDYVPYGTFTALKK